MLNFDDDLVRITVAENARYRTSAVTAFCWYRSHSEDQDDAPLLAMSTVGASETNCLYIGLGFDGGQRVVFTRAGANFLLGPTLNNDDFGLHSAAQVAYNTAGNTNRLYFDGIEADTAASNTFTWGSHPIVMGGITGEPIGTYNVDVGLCAWWNVELTAYEIAMLHAGFYPHRIRRQSLVGFWPLWGIKFPEVDLTGSGSMSGLNTPGFAQPAKTQFFLPRLQTSPVIPIFVEAGITESLSAAETNDSESALSSTLSESASLSESPSVLKSVIAASDNTLSAGEENNAVTELTAIAVDEALSQESQASFISATASIAESVMVGETSQGDNNDVLAIEASSINDISSNTLDGNSSASESASAAESSESGSDSGSSISESLSASDSSSVFADIMANIEEAMLSGDSSLVEQTLFAAIEEIAALSATQSSPGGFTGNNPYVLKCVRRDYKTKAVKVN